MYVCVCVCDHGHARDTNQLVTLLRTLPSPPIHVNTEVQLERQHGRLLEQVEMAHSLQPRLTAILVQQAGQFVGLTI